MKRDQRVTSVILVLLSLLFFASPVSSADLQSGPDVRKQFRFQLPGHWGLETFKIEESKNYGSGEEPIFKQFFTAGIVLLEDTYVLDQKDGAVSLLAPAAKAGEKRIVRGIATSVAKGTTWRTQWGLESDPTSGLGKTLSSFSGNVIIRGTSEEAEYLQKINKTRQKFFEQQARGRLALDLPGYWQLNTFSLSGDILQHIQDKRTEQNIEQKFTAMVELTSDTFKAVEKLGEVTILIPIAKTGEQKRIQGEVRASLGTLNQSIELEYDNNVAENLGEPKDFFQGRVLIDGTPELGKYRQQFHNQELTRRQRQKKIEEANNKIETARIAFAANLEVQRQMQLAKEREVAAKRETVERKKREQEMLLLKNKLFGSDQGIWLRAFKESLKSNDPQKQNLALASFLNMNKAINGVLIKNKSNKDIAIGPIRITITKLDLDTNEFTGNLNMLGYNGKVKGNLIRTVIYVECPGLVNRHLTTPPFSFSVQLGEDRTMMGSIRLSKFHWYFGKGYEPNMVIINLL